MKKKVIRGVVALVLSFGLLLSAATVFAADAVQSRAPGAEEVKPDFPYLPTD